MYWHKFDKRSDRIDQRAMPIGSLHIRAWRMRNGRWRLFVVRVDPCTGWSDDWWPVGDWYDGMTLLWHLIPNGGGNQKISFTMDQKILDTSQKGNKNT